jgi:arginyl-tRNA synthetase
MSFSRFQEIIRQQVVDAVQQRFGATLATDQVVFQETKREFEGDITLLVFPLTKVSRLSPELTAEQLGGHLVEHSGIVSRFNVVKGFLNLVIADDFWMSFFEAVSTDVHQLFAAGRVPARRLMVEYSSPNTNKPLHLGHIRNNLLGFSVAEILKAAGHEVTKVNLVNDRGIHICKSMLAWKKFGHGETPESAGMKGDHLVGKYYVIYDKKLKEQVEEGKRAGLAEETAEKQAPLTLEVQEMLRQWEAGDPETIALWKRMNAWVYAGFDETYRLMGVDFDKTYYESETYLLGKTIVEEGLNKGVFYKKEDGSVWIDLSDAGLDQKLVLRADGTSVYITQDLGTAQLRYDEFKGLESLIYVVGNEQEYHFKVLREIFRKLGRSWADGLYHLSYGMVDLPSGKMKSREGTVVDADDLIREVVEQCEMATKAQGKIEDFDSAEARHLYHTLGLGALKYFILKVDPKKRMLFNPAESIDINGNTGPFIQYAHARICSVLRKGEQAGIDRGTASRHMPDTGEKQLLRVLYRYPETLHDAAATLSPAQIANYAYELAKAYNHFWHDHQILDPSNPSATAFRLELSRITGAVIRESLRLLGIEAPERM